MMRTKIINLSVIFLFLLLGLGIFKLSVMQGGKFKELSNRNCIRLIPQPGARGRLLDRNQEVIVDNYLTYDVMILPQEKEQIDNVLSRVNEILGENPKELRDRFRRGYLAPFLPVCIKKNVDVKKAMALEELKTDLPNVIVQPCPLRKYPYGSLASHTLGYLSEIDSWRLSKLENYGYNSKDIVGFGGVEEKYDYFIRQEEGALSVEVDHKGKFVRVLGYKPPQNGRDVQLTLDLRIQKIAENSLSGRRGSVVVMDPNSGEILAMASFPTFNPAIFVNKTGPSIAKVFTDPNAPLLNRAISGVYSPGSVFKNVVASAGLETGKIKPSTSFFCSGSMFVGRRSFKCWNTHGQQDLNGALAHSCDIYFYRTGLAVGAQQLHDYAIKFGFGKNTGIDLPYELDGFVPSPLWRKLTKFANWYDGDTANFSIGQGDLTVTPLGVTRVMAAFANNGFLVNPYVVKNISGYDVSSYHKKAAKLAIKEGTLRAVNQGLRKAVSDPDGTANVLATLSVAVAGKTGTVQVDRKQPHGWFVGYFPYQAPKFVVCVFLEHGGSGFASTVLTKEIIEKMIQEGLI